MKRLLPILLLTCAHAGQPSDDLPVRLAHFHIHYDSFVRTYLGCPKGAQQVAECDPRTGSIDYHEFAQSCREAILLFSLPLNASACGRDRSN
jgi:hypothetical protein